MMHPMAKIGGSIFAGMLVASFFDAEHQLYVALGIFLLGFLIFYIFKNKKQVAVLIVITALGAGYFGIYTSLTSTPVTALDQTETEIQGYVVDQEQRTDGTYLYLVKVKNINGEEVKFRFNMQVYSDELWYCNYYDICKFTTTVYSTSNDDQLTLDDYQKSGGVFLSASLDDEVYVSITRNESFSIRRTLLNFRDSLTDVINDYLDSPQDQVMLGMLFGKTGGISSTDRLDFQQAGFSHMLAVSGLHLSVLTAFLSVILNSLGINKKISRVLCIAFVLCFMFMAGCTPSIVRASVMAILASNSILVSRRAEGINSLGIAAALILIVSPYSVMNISFLLSFSATLGILMLSPIVTEKIKQKLGLQRHLFIMLADSFSISLCATLFTIPVIVFAFDQLVVIAPISNLIAVPFGMAGLALGLITAISGLIPFLAPVTAVLAYLTQAVIWVLQNLAALFAMFPAVPLGYDYVVVWLVLSLCLILIVLIIKAPLKTKAMALASCILLFLIGTSVSFYNQNGMVTVTMFRSYYGYSTVITQDRHAVVINCGGGSNSGTQVVQYLKSKGISEIDAVVLTNAYKSAAQGVPDLIETFNVGRVIMPEEGSMRAEIEQVSDSTEIIDSTDMQLTGYSSEINIDNSYSRPVVYGKIGMLTFVYGEYANQIKQVSEEFSPDVAICTQDNSDVVVNFSAEYGIILTDNNVKILIDGTEFQSDQQVATLNCDSEGNISIGS